MYADQTSKLLVIFLCCLICICDCYTKCFSGKTLRQLFGPHLLCCFLSMYVLFLDVSIAFEDSDREWGTDDSTPVDLV